MNPSWLGLQFILTVFYAKISFRGIFFTLNKNSGTKGLNPGAKISERSREDREKTKDNGVVYEIYGRYI